MTTKVTNLNIDTTTITSLGTLTSLTVSGNIASGNANLGNLVTANYFTGNGSLLTGLSTPTSVATVTASSQPNITSTGSLVNLTVTGNVAFSGANVSVGNVANLKITGGASTQVLSTDGTGNVSFVHNIHPFVFLGI
jgi:hypothetical protein